MCIAVAGRGRTVCCSSRAGSSVASVSGVVGLLSTYRWRKGMYGFSSSLKPPTKREKKLPESRGLFRLLPLKGFNDGIFDACDLGQVRVVRSGRVRLWCNFAG